MNPESKNSAQTKAKRKRPIRRITVTDCKSIPKGLKIVLRDKTAQGLYTYIDTVPTLADHFKASEVGLLLNAIQMLLKLKYIINFLRLFPGKDQSETLPTPGFRIQSFFQEARYLSLLKLLY